MIISEKSKELQTSTYSKSAPFLAKINQKRKLVLNGSTKQTYHLELDIKNSGIIYKPGDSIGVLPQNDMTLVHQYLAALNVSGEELIMDSRSGSTLSVKDFLSYKANLARLPSSFIKTILDHEKVAEKRATLENLLNPENKQQLLNYLEQHDPLHVLNEYQSDNRPLQAICSQFAPLLPRFYSISSSQKAHPDEIHLTIALFTFAHAGQQKRGVASHFLCEFAKEVVTHIPIYVQPSHSFFLPDDQNAPIIMVGPGTGVAPFRAFLQERQALGSSGKNWLFFGERNQRSDFFYEEYFTELTNAQKLRLDLAFSRDQDEKIYVQHKMLESSKDLWNWLQDGAYFYICGDAERMAKDVDQALLQIAQKEGGLSEESAKAYLKSLKAEKRYRADIY
jgi:sulfite reductase (NADPH) flavoprotein alpha-component